MRSRTTSNGDAARAIPSLDGLRAISITLVLLAHLQHTRMLPQALSSRWLDHGRLGVKIFFVISGFLITRVIAQEIERTGRLSVKLFFIRRALRILPASYAYLMVVTLAASLHWLAIPLRNLLAAAFYSMNYVLDGRWETGHLWSLAVEEQFYLLWPLTIATLGMRRALSMAAIIAVAAPYGLLLLLTHDSATYTLATTTFPFVFDGIAAGCVLGGCLGMLMQSTRFQRALVSPCGRIVPFVVVALDSVDHQSRIYHAAGQLLITVAVCYSVARYTQVVDSPGAGVLASRPLIWIGRRSYSLYLWQQLFLDPYQSTVLQMFPVNLACAFVCAAASYRWIELPFNALRSRFRIPLEDDSSARESAGRHVAPRVGAASFGEEAERPAAAW